MPLVETLPILGEIIDTPPIKLEYAQLDIPEDVDFTFIGVEHDYRFGEPDYMESALKETDVFFYEIMGWNPAVQKRLQRIAKGDFKARNQQKEFDSRFANSDDEHIAFQAKWDMALHAALYHSGVRVELPDYPYNHREFRPSNFLAIVNAHNDDPAKDDIDTFQTWRRREQFNLSTICSSIAHIRDENSRLASESPLKVLAVYGWLHNSIFAALAAGAAEKGIDSFKTRSMYQAVDLVRMEQYFGSDPDESAVAREAYAEINAWSVKYCNWLRTPDTRTT